MTTPVHPAQQNPGLEDPGVRQPAPHRLASTRRKWSRKRRTLTSLTAIAVLIGGATAGLTLTDSGHHRSERDNPNDVHLSQPAWLTTRDDIAAVTCANPSRIQAWGQEPDAVGGIYYECAGSSGAQVFIDIFGSVGSEELFAERVGGDDDSVGQQTVVGRLWAVTTEDQAALTASLDSGGRLL